MMTMVPTMLAGANFVMHAAGWLESGLVSCYEKFVIDVEILRMLYLDGELRALAEEARSRRLGARQRDLTRKTLDEYDQPPMEDGLREQLEEFVTRRRAELGD